MIPQLEILEERICLSSNKEYNKMLKEHLKGYEESNRRIMDYVRKQLRITSNRIVRKKILIIEISKKEIQIYKLKEIKIKTIKPADIFRKKIQPIQLKIKISNEIYNESIFTSNEIKTLTKEHFLK